MKVRIEDYESLRQYAEYYLRKNSYNHPLLKRTMKELEKISGEYNKNGSVVVEIKVGHM